MVVWQLVIGSALKKQGQTVGTMTQPRGDLELWNKKKIVFLV